MARKLTVLTLGILLLSCSGEKAEEEHHEGLKARKVLNGGAVAQAVGDGFIIKRTRFPGEVVRDMRRSATVRARFSGLVKATYRLPGDAVRKGDVLAVIESDRSLSEYRVLSPLSGRVGEQFVSAGEVVEKGDPIYEVLDLSSVWIRALAYPHMSDLLRRGKGVVVVRETPDGSVELSGRILSVSPHVDAQTRLLPFTVEVPSKGKLRPGMYVDVVLTDSAKVEVFVPKEAVHTLEGDTVVFVKLGDDVEPKSVKLGRRGDNGYEVLKGLKVGDTVFVRNSFVIKAEIERREWEGEGHEH